MVGYHALSRSGGSGPALLPTALVIIRRSQLCLQAHSGESRCICRFTCICICAWSHLVGPRQVGDTSVVASICRRGARHVRVYVGNGPAIAKGNFTPRPKTTFAVVGGLARYWQALGIGLCIRRSRLGGLQTKAPRFRLKASSNLIWGTGGTKLQGLPPCAMACPCSNDHVGHLRLQSNR